jgi:hypothetical protein
MKDFSIEITVTTTHYIDIEAANEASAEKKALKIAKSAKWEDAITHNNDDPDIQIEDITEIDNS